MMPATMATAHSTMVRYRGDIVAIVTPRLIVFTGPLADLDRSHPDVRFVYVMGVYAGHVLAGDLPGPYTDQDAETFARTFLDTGDDQPR